MSARRIVQDAQPVTGYSFRKTTDGRHDGGIGRDLGAREGIVRRRRGLGLLGLSSRFSGLGNLFDGSESRFLRADKVTLPVSDEGCKVLDRLVFVKAKIVIQEEEKLLFHKIYLGEIEKGGISRPVLVFGRRVVEIFCSNDESRQEDTVSGTRHACNSGIRISGG